jgi:cobaltochelatase CobN
VNRGFAPVPQELYHNEWERRKLRNKVHLSFGGCLGPCALANVALLLYAGREVWFHSIATEEQILAIYDYIEELAALEAYIPPPPALAPNVFSVFNWPAAGALPTSESSGVPIAPPVSTPGFGFLLLTHADTDILTLNGIAPTLPGDFPPIRAYNIASLGAGDDLLRFLDRTAPTAQVIIVRLHGGRASFQDGLERLVHLADQHDLFLLCVSGTDELDPELTALSTADAPTVQELFAFLQLGGTHNYEHALRFLSDHLLTTGHGYDAPAPLPRVGFYHPDLPGTPTLAEVRARHWPEAPTIGLLFYRAHLLAGNTAFVDALVRAIERRGANVLPVFSVASKEEAGAGETLSPFLQPFAEVGCDALINTMSFAMGGVNPDGPTMSGWAVEQLAVLDAPVFQAITAQSSRLAWEGSGRGLGPLDTAMNVAIPEFDGRIVTVPISFKEERRAAGDGATPGTHYAPLADRVERVVGLALRHAALRRMPNAEKRVAFVLTNSTAKASRIGNAVGLDAPASLLRLMTRLRDEGYTVGDLPPDGDTLIHDLIARCSYDSELLTAEQLRDAVARVPAATYATWQAELAPQRRDEMARQWGQPPGMAYLHDNTLALAGLAFGNLFVALQPPRGYGMDPNLIYHLPDLPPPHHYHALYRWLRDEWGADAIVHVGKHGTLEWLPGKGLGLSASCYPDAFLGDLPLLYPFIINDPGEGTQAKRRTHAVVIDHMTPPMTTAGVYGQLAELQQLVDEYYQVEKLDPSKLPILQGQIWDVVKGANLDSDLNAILNREKGDHLHEWDDTMTEEGTPVLLTEMIGPEIAHLIEDIDGYLCELAGAQIRDGLHILGAVPEGETLIALLYQLVRLANLAVPALPATIAAAYGLDLATLQANPGARLELADAPRRDTLADAADTVILTAGEALDAIDTLGQRLLRATLAASDETALGAELRALCPGGDPAALGEVARPLRFVRDEVLPNLRRNTEEIDNVARALDGRYIPAGPSGAPTRGMAHVLPTGRNFYAADPRALPSQAAWEVGQQLADQLLRRHLADEGDYPESVGISIWGTSAMRTYGDDVAEVFALLGVRPRWQAENHRLIGIEVVPLADLDRPRIDVVCRISGFFRDAFPHLIALIDDAVRQVATLDEPIERNLVRKRYLAAREGHSAAGSSPAEAEERALRRIYGPKPGSYGAGILPLIDERNWSDMADFAAAYVNWGGYAYSATEFGTDARDDFRRALGGVAVAVKNQDNREHDIFDSDDYLQFHGGMIATIRSLTGKKPRAYFGDSADPARAQVRDLKEEALRVFRTRVVNPKWLDSITRHGYKGALELAATVDYLFGYDATADLLDDWMYADVARQYALDPAMQAFFRRSNPWALRDVTERLLEAASRGLWADPDPDLLERLRATYLAVDGELEGRQEATRR